MAETVTRPPDRWTEHGKGWDAGRSGGAHAGSGARGMGPGSAAGSWPEDRITEIVRVRAPADDAGPAHPADHYVLQVDTPGVLTISAAPTAGSTLNPDLTLSNSDSLLLFGKFLR